MSGVTAITTDVHGNRYAAVHVAELDEWAWLLARLEDWLLHAQTDTAADWADFSALRCSPRRRSLHARPRGHTHARPGAGPTMTTRTPTPPPLDDELEALLRRMRLPHIRRAAPEVLATARSQRWEPAEVLRVLLAEEVAGRDRSSTATRLAAGVRGININEKPCLSSLAQGRAPRYDDEQEDADR